VEYELTEMGTGVIPLRFGLCDWLASNKENREVARSRFSRSMETGEG
jgi:DNA-binding HxlR family transcriptional regulator